MASAGRDSLVHPCSRGAQSDDGARPAEIRRHGRRVPVGTAGRWWSRRVRFSRAVRSRAIRCSRRTAANWRSSPARTASASCASMTSTRARPARCFRSAVRAWPLYPSWSPDGKQIVFQHTRGIFDPYRIVVVNVADGMTREVAQGVGAWTARPHFSSDGANVYLTSRVSEMGGAVSRLASGRRTASGGDQSHEARARGLVSPDGKWLAIRSNSEIWMAPMSATPVADAALKRVSTEGGRSFSFRPIRQRCSIRTPGRSGACRSPVVRARRFRSVRR